MKEVEYVSRADENSTQPEPKKHWTEKVVPLRTYSDDVAEALQSGEITKTKIIIAEQERRHNGPTNSDSEHRHLLMGIGVSFVLLIVLMGIIAIVFFGVGRDKPISEPTGATSIQKQEAKKSSGASGVEEKILDITNGFRAQVIADLRIFSEELNRTPGIVFLSAQKSNRDANLGDLFLLLSHHPIPTFLGESSPFRLIMLRTPSPSVVLVIQFSSYGETLNGMIGMEKEIARWMHGVLDPYDESSFVTLEMKEFQNTVIQQEEARVLRGESGEVRFVWGIVNRSKLVLSPNEKSFIHAVSMVRENLLAF